MNISIIIPNYNGQDLLRKNLTKVLEAAKTYMDKTGDVVEVVVVDDASSDSSIATIQQFNNSTINNKNTIKIIENERNLGFSSTVNRGVKEAKGEIVVLLNTDVVPEKDFLSPLIKHFEEDSNIFAVGCMDKSIEGKKIVLRGRGLGKWQKGLLVHRRGEVGKTNTLWVSGGSGGFRKSIWDKLGGFNELYNPFYWEDIDLSYRGLKSGYKILFEPKSIVFHNHEEGTIKKMYSPFQIKTIVYRNQFIFVWENVTDLDLQFLHVFWLPYHFLRALLRFDVAFFLGFLAALVRLPEIIQSSFQAQKLFKKSDNETIHHYSSF